MIFKRGKVLCFHKVDKICLGVLPHFIEKFPQFENLLFSSMDRIKSALGIVQLMFNYFAEVFLKALGTHLFMESKEKDASAINGFILVSLFVCGDDQLSLPIRLCFLMTLCI